MKRKPRTEQQKIKQALTRNFFMEALRREERQKAHSGNKKHHS